MKEILLTSFVSAVCAMMLACGSDSGTNSGSNGGAINTPSVGDTSAILQPHECKKIMQALPVQPELPYVTVNEVNSDNQCNVEIPTAVDSSTIMNFLNNLSAYGEAIAPTLVEKGSQSWAYSYSVNMGVTLWYEGENHFSIRLESDCRNAAYVANIPEKDSIWNSEGDDGDVSCTLYTSAYKYSEIPMTQMQLEEKMATLVADGWAVTTGCARRLDLDADAYCFQKQVNNYLFELGYGPDENGALLDVGIAFSYQMIP